MQIDLSRYKLDWSHKHTGVAAGVLLAIWVYFSLIVGPNSERLQALENDIALKERQISQLKNLGQRQGEIDALIGPGGENRSIESRVEQVGRELGVRPLIRKVADGSGSEPNTVEVRLGGLYLKELIDFLKKIEAFPVTIQIVRLEVTKVQSRGGIVLLLSDLRL